MSRSAAGSALQRPSAARPKAASFSEIAPALMSGWGRVAGEILSMELVLKFTAESRGVVRTGIVRHRAASPQGLDWRRTVSDAGDALSFNVSAAVTLAD